MLTLRATYQVFQNWIKDQILFQKLFNSLGITILLTISLAISFVFSLINVQGAALISVGLLGLPIIFFCITNMYFGIVVTLIAGYLVNYLGKVVEAPFGLALDGLLMLLSLGMLVNMSKTKEWKFAQHPISFLIVLWIYYNLLQVINPWAQSRLAWAFTVRTVAVMHVLYFITCYVANNRKTAINLVKWIIIAGFLATLYGLKQEYFGFSAAELAWLYADELRFQLIVQWGRFRIFSVCSDPTAFGILMAYLGVFCFVLATGPLRWKHKIGLIIIGISMMMALAYAGSRTPVVLVPAGLVFYLMMSINKTKIIFGAIFLFLGAATMMKSTSNPVIYRLQSAFKPQEDASLQLRLDNQKIIQPFIQTHPVGAGLGSTGEWGKRFTPDSWLASFAHDSFFVRLGVETGWIGLIIYMALLLAIARTAIYHYFRVRDPFIKTIYLGFSTVIFMIILGSYPQEVIPLSPTSIIFYILVGLIVRLKDFDQTPEEPTIGN